ncbi:hypothetical protein RB195_009375 [Necator americanus]|uniref:Ion transport domain-containing protein n=1 Tax=Necator americanus TaxID=51031 RepID=A0ABR1CT27_NECAM
MWQTLRKQSAQERSTKVIGLGLLLLLVILFLVGIFVFKVKDFNTIGFAALRDEVISNYTEYLYTHQKNVSVYDLFVSIDETMLERSQPVMVDPRIDPVSVVNMMLGIYEEFHTSDSLLVNAYFFVANLVISFIIICLCHILDRKFNEHFAKDWTGFSCPPRDILLEFRKKLSEAKEGDGKIRVCSMPNPPPKCPERTAFLHRVRYPRPAIKLLLVLLIFSTLFAGIIAIFKKTDFPNEFFAVLNFCAAIAPFPSTDTFWDIVIWIISLFGVILYSYTMYGLTLIIIDLVYSTLGVKERITPILID